ncbi:hypothetical protein AFK24_21185 [Pseudomonas syringae]|uniref:Uncharacterized protein n=1 Tax=Pseudomonas syringae TaxID=317 RepID=A0A1C7YZ38_PSESX|nr:hypothetical protein [Pseudomonas syringae]OCR23044.1 hypothetical protein AFK24_21185 [Pseudomonas syringae]
MDYLEAIRLGKKHGLPYHEIARKLYLSYPTHAFVGAEEEQYRIFNAISMFFNIPITSVQVAGSAKTGHSFHKGTCFTAGISDLDIAIIDSGLFIKYMELVCATTRNYTDLTRFPSRRGVSTSDTYLDYLSRGIFRPDLMPSGNKRAEVNDFFGQLSALHGSLFSTINVAFYLSHSFFEKKQRSTIKLFLDKDIY